MKKIFSPLIILYFVFNNITLLAQCKITVENDSIPIVCGGSAQLDATAPWLSLNSGSSKQDFKSVYFVNPDTGWIVGGSGLIIKTIDGGANWVTQKCSSALYASMESVFFTSADTGYIAAGLGILKTTDGGANWNYLTNGAPMVDPIFSIFFVNSNIGYYVGEYGLIYKTTDAGNNWTKQTSVATWALHSVYFTSADTGYIAGNSETILKTTDGGTHWDTIRYNANGNMFFTIYFIDAQIGFVSGVDPTLTKFPMMQTKDGGKTWSVKSTNEWIRSFFFVNSNTGYAVGANYSIYKTTNAGTDWKIVTTEKYGASLTSVFFTDSINGYAVGYNSKILKFSSPDSFIWSPSNYLSSTHIFNPISKPDSTILYTITTYTKGCVAKDSVTVYLNPLEVNVNDVYPNCDDSAIFTSSTNYMGTGTLTYSWSPTIGLSDSTIANPVVNINKNTTYYITLKSSEGCIASDSAKVLYILPKTPHICIIGVDNSNKNMIVWMKTDTMEVDSYYIYKEGNITNAYAIIGTVSRNDLSVFVDTLSNPTIQSNKYRITTKDICGNESFASDYHKTMHLSINQGVGGVWNLIWEPYEGFTVSSYRIYRGTSPNNLQLIGSTTSGSTQYSDLTPPSGYIYYQVEIIGPQACNPSITYQTSRSNIATNNPNSVQQVKENLVKVEIYPNPASDIIVLNTNISGDYIFSIYDITGTLVRTEKLFQNKQEVNIRDLSDGIYIVELKANEWLGKQKLIIQK